MIRDQDLSPFSEYQSAFLRRASPPGSPGTSAKKCCYAHKDSNLYSTQQSSIFCCCYSCPSPKSTSILATLGVCFLVLGYTIIGAFIFMALEGDLYQDTAVAASKLNPRSDNTAIGTLRAETVSRLWSITEDLNILYKENWTKLAAEEVLVFQNALFQSLRNGESGYNVQMGTTSIFYQNGHKWSFSSSFLYSLTLITTIDCVWASRLDTVTCNLMERFHWGAAGLHFCSGRNLAALHEFYMRYGSVAPRTPWGKLVTIIYALIGIPLMLLYLSTTGDVLARSFRRLYAKFCKTTPQKPQQQQCACSNNVRVPVLLCLLIVLAYICSGAMLFHRLENWSLLEGSYFCFTSLGTIGFGDLLPGQNAEDISFCACSAYILTGMALVAMCFSLMQERVMSVLRYIGTSCSKSPKKSKEEESEMVLPDS